MKKWVAARLGKLRKVQILFIGAEFTKAYANRFGGRVRPAKNAMPMTAEARAQQGLSPTPAVNKAER
jgi:membrane protein